MDDAETEKASAFKFPNYIYFATQNKKTGMPPVLEEIYKIKEFNVHMHLFLRLLRIHLHPQQCLE